MTADSIRIFGCPTCGFRVSEGDSACPRCGNAFSTATRFECPFCGELIDQGSSECPSCRVNYNEFRQRTEERGGDDSIDSLLLDIIQLEAQSARTETKKFSCPGCSWMLDSGTERCPRCGRDFTSEEEAFQCPICGSAVSADAASCPECGSSFDVAEEVAGMGGEQEPRGVARAIEAADALERAAYASREKWPSEARHEEKARAQEPKRAEPVLKEETTRPEIVHETRKEPPQEAEPAPPVEALPEPPRVVFPKKVMVKPAPEPEPEPVKEQELESLEPALEELEKAAQAKPAAGPKKARQRKLKSKSPKKG